MDRKVLSSVWYAVPNDLIGGWVVRTVDEPPSYGHGYDVADFMTEDIAKYVAELHNEHLRITGKSVLR